MSYSKLASFEEARRRVKQCKICGTWGCDGKGCDPRTADQVINDNRRALAKKLADALWDGGWQGHEVDEKSWLLCMQHIGRKGRDIKVPSKETRALVLDYLQERLKGSNR